LRHPTLHLQKDQELTHEKNMHTHPLLCATRSPTAQPNNRPTERPNYRSEIMNSVARRSS
jgi:hypothetical protein